MTTRTRTRPLAVEASSTVPRLDWVGRWRTPAPALAATRITYALGLLFIWPPLDTVPLGGVDSSLWFAAIGPFQLLGGYPGAGLLLALEALCCALLVLLAAGLWTRGAGIGFAVAATFLAGVRFATGKIDHDIVLLTIVPLAMSFSAWGTRLSLDSLIARMRGRSTADTGSAWPVAVVALALGVEFFCAGLVKAVTGWLDPSTSAVRAWVRQYVVALNPNPVSVRAVNVEAPLMWELFDVATIVFEIGFLVVILSRVWTRFYVVGAMGFHLGILALMGIDFGKLALVYLLLLLPATMRKDGPPPSHAPDGRRVLALVAVAVAAAIGAGALRGQGPVPSVLSLFPPSTVPFTPGAAIMFAFLVFAAVMALRVRHEQPPVEEPGRSSRWWPLPVALAVALVTTGMTLAVSEPFPALMGPLFWGDRSTAEGSEVMIQEFAWTDADGIEQLAPVSELYGVPHHFAMNLGAFQFPAVDDPRGWIEPIGDTRARSQGFDFLATPWHPAPGATGERFCEMARDALPDAVALEVRWVAVEHADGGEVGRRTLVDYRVLGAGGSCGS